MTWLSWRQIRAQAAVLYLAAAVVALYAAITGPHLHDLARLGGSVFDQLTRNDIRMFYTGVIVLAIVPPVVGAFWGAPLVAREIETGTHRLVWSQSVTRTRWLASRLGLTVLTAAVAVGVLMVAVNWWSGPLDGTLSTTRGSLPDRLTPITFAMRGVAPVAYTVFAVVLGALVGAVVRRTVPAMALTLALVIAAQIAVPLWVRPHLLSPVETTVALVRGRIDSLSVRPDGTTPTITVNTGSHGDWIVANETIDGSGKVTALPTWVSDCFGRPPLAQGQAQVQAQAQGPVQAPPIDDCLERLTAEGYQQHLAYFPASRFWALQWAEAALYLVGSVLIAGLCFWWTRTRVS